MNPGQGKRAAAKLAKLQAQCDAWNAVNPVGCSVILTKDNGEDFPTTTRSLAEVLSGHSAVIWVNGIRGCYLLDRVKRMPVVLEFEGESYPLTSEGQADV